MKNLQQTNYQDDVNIDIYNGVSHCDSGFLGFVPMEVALEHYLMVPKEADSPRTRAFEYFLFFTSSDIEAHGAWSVVDKLLEAQRGDIVVWQLAGFQPGGDTGLAFFVADTPKLLDSGIITVPVYDSAAYARFDDTLPEGETGVGPGFINFQVGGNGAPIAIQFGPSDQFISRPMAIGRVEPLLGS